MTLPATRPVWERSVAPLPLLAGIVLSFLGCCLAGRVLARVNCLRGFTRFHSALNYQTLYYPTVSQVRALARERLQRNKIAVVLGGNCILHGFGQGAAGNWANRLQELLGDDFQVLNLGLPYAHDFQFGGVAAEVLLREHPRLIFLTNNVLPIPSLTVRDPDGQPLLRYFYWQAQARGLLADNPERDAALSRLEGERDESFRELRRQCALDARLSFHDLWNAAAYRCASTVWCPLLASSWTRRRSAYPDLDPAVPPLDECAAAACAPKVVESMRASVVAAMRRFIPPDRQGDWREPDAELPQSVRECLPPCLRGRTLVLLNHHCPYYMDQLKAEERQIYSRSFAVMTRLFARAGVRAVEANRDLPTGCFIDAVHLTAKGGRRLAEEVAPLIRELAEQLGYQR